MAPVYTESNPPQLVPVIMLTAGHRRADPIAQMELISHKLYYKHKDILSGRPVLSSLIQGSNGEKRDRTEESRQGGKRREGREMNAEEERRRKSAGFLCENHSVQVCLYL